MTSRLTVAAAIVILIGCETRPVYTPPPDDSFTKSSAQVRISGTTDDGAR